LAKEITRLVEVKGYEKLQARGGLMDGARLTAAQVAEVSKWPSREEQLSLLMGQILGPGARLASQLSGPGGALASQVKEKAKQSEGEGTEEAAGETAEQATGEKAEQATDASQQPPPEGSAV
jgi:ribosomal protein L10